MAPKVAPAPARPRVRSPVEVAASRRPPEPKVGEVLGEYELVDLIGRGGMGVIFLARREGGGDQVALKVLTGAPDGADKRRERFSREIGALRRLSHPNIVSVHESGSTRGFDWYVMDYVQGKELKDALVEDDLPRQEKLRIFLDICKAVSHAHERSVVHRDLKPANVLLDATNQVFVLDFGLAKLADDELGLTRTGATLGTPYYMAPEQFENPKDADVRTDVWALGVLLYEMLVGRRPFEGATAGELGYRVVHEPFVRPTKANPTINQASFDQIVLKALEKDPALRYQRVEELRRAVKRYKRGNGASDVSLGSQVKHSAVGSWVRNHRAGILVGVAIATVLYVPLVLAGLWYLAR